VYKCSMWCKENVIKHNRPWDMEYASCTPLWTTVLLSSICYFIIFLHNIVYVYI
jgi:hypothetical protein